MPRNAEVIRQWNILRELDASHYGRTIDELAAQAEVTTRTIRRDLEALQQVGFPIVDHLVEGKRRWRLDAKPFKGLTEEGFTLAEVCALYFSRSLLEGLAGVPFSGDLQHAFDKLQRALQPAMRRFLDRLPGVLGAKPSPGRGGASGAKAERERVSVLLGAILDGRRVRARYHSFASNRVKDYVLEPHRVIYGQGALYLIAYVPEYRQVRTFALDRIKRLSSLEERFDPPADALTAEVFPNSLGIHSGPSVRVVLDFEAGAGPYIRERRWHPTQQLAELGDGRVRLSMDVCNDWALKAWILGFGALVRVVEPSSLADEIQAELEHARTLYARRLELEMPPVRLERDTQRILPFPELRGSGGTPSRRPPTAATG